MFLSSLYKTAGWSDEAQTPSADLNALSHRLFSPCYCHAATGYSITRSLREAPATARAVQLALQEQSSSAAAVRYVWEALWTQERRRQVMHVVMWRYEKSSDCEAAC